jgi:hypothetical protein
VVISVRWTALIPREKNSSLLDSNPSKVMAEDANIAALPEANDKNSLSIQAFDSSLLTAVDKMLIGH